MHNIPFADVCFVAKAVGINCGNNFELHEFEKILLSKRRGKNNKQAPN